jgi:hypothetical protein
MGDVAEEVGLELVDLAEAGVRALQLAVRGLQLGRPLAHLGLELGRRLLEPPVQPCVLDHDGRLGREDGDQPDVVLGQAAGLVGDRDLPDESSLVDQGNLGQVVHAERPEEGALLLVELLGPLVDHRPLMPEVPGRPERIRRVANLLEQLVRDVVAGPLAHKLARLRLVE